MTSSQSEGPNHDLESSLLIISQEKANFKAVCFNGSAICSLATRDPISQSYTVGWMLKSKLKNMGACYRVNQYLPPLLPFFPLAYQQVDSPKLTEISS